MIWLNYMLNLKKVNDTNNLNDFYIKYTEKNTNYEYCKTDGIDCGSALKDKTGYNNFKEFIEANKFLLNIKFEDASKVYDSFKLLCNLFYGVNVANPNSEEYLRIANQFVEKYKELNGYSDITEDSPYYQVLSTLSNDYNNIINKCIDCQSSNFPTLPTYSRISVIKNTLISIAFIFASVSIFLVFVIWISETIPKTTIKRKTKKYKEENESLIYYSKSSDYFRNSNDDLHMLRICLLGSNF
ncbi:putative yir1 protein [Plasmodium yoelii yoelii]|uniref:Yir1 protein n=1 Tax=Plasmodium yoelii yoelii TaxID=73239 RepID=Q7RKS6_PLAYO|nr:putative yir1 protein [Plasmodium yoelii yoelii]